jgi:hypothetical protein
MEPSDAAFVIPPCRYRIKGFRMVKVGKKSWLNQATCAKHAQKVTPRFCRNCVAPTITV